jgi:hypothetical protein
MVDPLGLDMQVQWHPVAGPYNHTLIRVTPANQGRYANDSRFTGDAGRRFVTFGAGPIKGMVQSDFNRERDAAPHADGVKFGPRDEDALIDALFAADARYLDNAEYDLFPVPGGITPLDNGWNSNSYVSGLLTSVGIDPRGIALPRNIAFPGWDKPIPITGP